MVYQRLYLSGALLLHRNQSMELLWYDSFTSFRILSCFLIQSSSTQQVVGTQIQVKIVKNKHAPPFRTVQLELEFGKGLSRELEIIELGCEHKLITKSGVFYNMNRRTFQGKDAIKRYLMENRDVQEDLMAMIREKIKESSQLDKNKMDLNPDTSSSEQIVSTTDEEVHNELEA